MIKDYYSNGKLLLTGEYAVLDGALSLAVPTTFGQSLKVEEIDAPHLAWKSVNEKAIVWYESVFELETLFSEKTVTSMNTVEATLTKILREARVMNPDFLKGKNGYRVETTLSFNKEWGLGSSSTLINNIAQWAEVDAYMLLWNSFSGSGYDIACARHNTPIFYQLLENAPSISKVDFNPPFADRIFFIHLDKKQNSREGIAQYRKMKFDVQKLTSQISKITEKIASCSHLSVFEELITEHEKLISEVLQLKTVKESLFPDFTGAIKSLGAWGGDFVLATGNQSTPSYFRKKGFSTVLTYAKMVLDE